MAHAPGCAIAAHSLLGHVRERPLSALSYQPIGHAAGTDLFVPKPSSEVIAVRMTAADLPVLSVSVRRRVWAAGGIVAQLVTHSRLSACMGDRLLAKIHSGCPAPAVTWADQSCRSREIR